jgi:hypothetical protein
MKKVINTLPIINNTIGEVTYIIYSFIISIFLLPTNGMEQNSLSEANNISRSTFFRLLWHPKVQCRVNKSLPLAYNYPEPY